LNIHEVIVLILVPLLNAFFENLFSLDPNYMLNQELKLETK